MDKTINQHTTGGAVLGGVEWSGVGWGGVVWDLSVIPYVIQILLRFPILLLLFLFSKFLNFSILLLLFLYFIPISISSYFRFLHSISKEGRSYSKYILHLQRYYKYSMVLEVLNLLSLSGYLVMYLIMSLQ